jgi:hypothetical protein
MRYVSQDANVESFSLTSNQVRMLAALQGSARSDDSRSKYCSFVKEVPHEGKVHRFRCMTSSKLACRTLCDICSSEVESVTLF